MRVDKYNSSPSFSLRPPAATITSEAQLPIVQRYKTPPPRAVGSVLLRPIQVLYARLSRVAEASAGRWQFHVSLSLRQWQAGGWIGRLHIVCYKRRSFG